MISHCTSLFLLPALSLEHERALTHARILGNSPTCKNTNTRFLFHFLTNALTAWFSAADNAHSRNSVRQMLLIKEIQCGRCCSLRRFNLDDAAHYKGPLVSPMPLILDFGITNAAPSGLDFAMANAAHSGPKYGQFYSFRAKVWPICSFRA